MSENIIRDTIRRLAMKAQKLLDEATERHIEEHMPSNPVKRIEHAPGNGPRTLVHADGTRERLWLDVGQEPSGDFVVRLSRRTDRPA
jgi:hypothetical protein